MFSVQDEYKTLVDIAGRTAGGSHGSLLGQDDAVYVVVHANKVLAHHELPGVSIEATELPDGIEAHISVADGTVLPKPVHLCFGHLGSEGRQTIQSKIHIGKGARAVFLAHCIFPNALEFLHAMEGEIVVDEGGDFSYNEVHVHGPDGKITVRPVSRVVLERGAIYRGDFTLVEGRVGDLDIRIDVDARGARSRVEITSKVYGKDDDQCQVQDVVRLSGEGSTALIKARVVLRDRSEGRFLGLIEGGAAGARGHVDCTEIVQGVARAEASPVVRVTHPDAELTHEAAIGRIADDKIEGLMAKGLDEEHAIDAIVSGLLR